MHRIQSTPILMIGLVCGLFAVVLCSTDESSPPPTITESPPTIIEAQITASPQANPDLKGRPSPIVVHLYGLKAASGFESADFYALFNNAKALLAGNLVAKKSFYLQPGENQLYRNTVAARQIPFHAGFSYFEIDNNNALWKELATTGTIAMHFAGEYPELELEFWAIRG